MLTLQMFLKGNLVYDSQISLFFNCKKKKKKLDIGHVSHI